MASPTKPSASLTSGLLARKGQARPAMRPQGYLNLGGQPLDDLGWNDMGEGAPAPEADKAEVVTKRESLSAQFNQAEPRPLPAAAVARLRREVSAPGKAKTAFTLRLDADRHLRLRLACAVSNRSAQQLVTQALDNLLESMTEVEALARQIPSAQDRG